MKKYKKRIELSDLLITDYAAEGKAIGRHEGKVIFTEGTIPGDVVNVLLLKNKKDWANAKVLKIVTPSKDRIEPFCKHFGLCGGCKWQMLPYNKQLEFKQQEATQNLLRIGKISDAEILPIVGADEQKYYRNKLEFTFSNKEYREFQPPHPPKGGFVQVSNENNITKYEEKKNAKPLNDKNFPIISDSISPLGGAGGLFQSPKGGVVQVSNENNQHNYTEEKIKGYEGSKNNSTITESNSPLGGAGGLSHPQEGGFVQVSNENNQHNYTEEKIKGYDENKNSSIITESNSPLGGAGGLFQSPKGGFVQVSNENNQHNYTGEKIKEYEEIKNSLIITEFNSPLGGAGGVSQTPKGFVQVSNEINQHNYTDEKIKGYEEIKKHSIITESNSPLGGAGGLLGGGGAGALGYHAPRVFDKTINIEECFLMDDVNNRIRNSIREIAAENNFSYYDIREHTGWLRNIIVRHTTIAGLMVNLCINYDDEDNTKIILDALLKTVPEITTLLYTVNPKWNDTIYDLTPQVYFGKGYVTEKLENFEFIISPKSFFQTNTKQAEKLYSIARDFAQLTGEEVLYDLYCGTGSIGIFMSPLAKKIIGVELVEDAIEDAKKNAANNNITHASFFAGDVIKICNDDFFETHGRPDVVITDPPRAGMHEKLVIKLLQIAAPVIVYVSCNTATMARDLLLLSEKYNVVKVQTVDMFPHTQHIECVAKLELKK